MSGWINDDVARYHEGLEAAEALRDLHDEARRAVLPPNHKDCRPDVCYRAGEVEAVLFALAKAGFTLSAPARVSSPLEPADGYGPGSS